MTAQKQTPPSIEQVVERIKQATEPRPAASHLPPARFILAVTAGESAAVAARVVQELAALKPSVTRLHPTDPTVLALTFADRLLKKDDSAFEAAYALLDRYNLDGCEPDIETSIYVEPKPKTEGPGEEGFDDFPPGCWAENDASLNGKLRWALEKIKVPEAWAYSKSEDRPVKGQGIIVAQPDTGVAPHVVLDGIERLPGYDFVQNDNDPTDPLDYSGTVGHGTATASVLIGHDSGPMSGSAPRATHLPIRAIESVVRLSQVRVAQSVNYAVDKGAHVITMSLGGTPSISLGRALKRAVTSDVIVLAAAGNCVGFVVWPARYDLCIAVAGVNKDFKPWQGTCSGADVDISAPGENVFRAKVIKNQTTKGVDVVQGQGTSFAVALTAGVAALWLAHHGRANLIAAARARNETLQAMFVRLLRATAQRPAGWNAALMGAGIVDANALLRADFDLGCDLETTVQIDLEDSSAMGVRRLVTEAVSAKAGQADLDWNKYGMEVALGVFGSKAQKPAGRAKVTLEAGDGAQPTLSPSLKAAIASSPDREAFKGMGG